MSEILFYVFGAMALAFIIHYQLVLRPRARDAYLTAYQAVVGLSDAARAAHRLTEIDMRTAVSMYGVGPKSFIEERNPAAQRAKMRGYEVWRNQQIEPVQFQLKAAYNRYEAYTRRLIEIVNREEESRNR